MKYYKNDILCSIIILLYIFCLFKGFILFDIDFDISISITYFTFIIGFIFTGYIAMSEKEVILNLKDSNDFYPIERAFKRVLYINELGLLVSILYIIISLGILYHTIIVLMLISIFNSIILINDIFVVLTKR